MKRGLIWVLFLVIFSCFALAEEKDCLYYFYGEGCGQCEDTKVFLEQMKAKHPALEVKEFEVYYNRGNSQLLQGYFHSYGIPRSKQGVPVVFLAKTYFLGSQAITQFLEGAITDNDNEVCPSAAGGEVVGILGSRSPRYLIETLSFSKVTGAALSDSFNPAALAVLLILLGLLLATEKRKRLWKTGLGFVFGAYLTVMYYSTGLVTAILTQGYIFPRVIGFLAVLFSLVIFWNFYKKKIFLEFKKRESPKKEKFYRKLSQAIKGVTFPATAFILGLFLSLFGLARLGEVHAVIRVLFSEPITRWAVFPLFVYYGLVFVLSLLVLTLVMYWVRKKVDEHEKHREKFDVHGTVKKARADKLKLLHLIVGIVMFVLGIGLVFW